MASLEEKRKWAADAIHQRILSWGDTPAPESDKRVDDLTRFIYDKPERDQNTEPYSWLVGSKRRQEREASVLESTPFPEFQLSQEKGYPRIESKALGAFSCTGGFQEPNGHSAKDKSLALFSDNKLTELPASNRNFGCDYVVDDEQVRAWLPGIVRKQGLEGSYGKRIHIETEYEVNYKGNPYKVWAAYAHLRSINVSTGDRVSRSQSIGTQGGTGQKAKEVYPAHIDIRFTIRTPEGEIDISPNLIEFGVKLVSLRNFNKALFFASQTNILTYWLPIADTLEEFQINTLDRIAAFLGQIAHESGSLKYSEEIASGEAYEGREDLGNTQPGDGKRYKGRGLIQLTGRANYRRFGEILNLELEENPELAREPTVAARIAGGYWKTHGLNKLADHGNYYEITRRINGGLRGWRDRVTNFKNAKQALA
jgi:predicted chitinase